MVISKGTDNLVFYTLAFILSDCSSHRFRNSLASQWQWQWHPALARSPLFSTLLVPYNVKHSLAAPLIIEFCYDLFGEHR